MTTTEAVRGQALLSSPSSSLLHPIVHHPPPKAVSAEGSYIILEDGRRILEASGGPAVACIGHGNREVTEAVVQQMNQISYCFALHYSNPNAEELARLVIESTNGALARATIMSSGSEAIEAAMKLAVKFFVEKGLPNKTGFIARRGAFHGTTLGSLALTGKQSFRKPFDPLLKDDMISFVSMPNIYRDMRDCETTEDYVNRLTDELDTEFQRRGADHICALVAETVSGSASGCHTAPVGYFPAIKSVCDKHQALLILDEVFCGMGRSGSYHAWQQESVVPDIQTIAKGVAGGYAPISMLLVHQRVVDAIDAGSGLWNHGHTFSSHPVACAAGVAVQRIIKRDRLIDEAARNGRILGELLHASLDRHPHVGDIRGRGMMWAVEFVRDKNSKLPFPPEDVIASKIQLTGLTAPWSIFLYPGSGTADGICGDHITIAPAYNVSTEQVHLIVRKLVGIVEEVLGPS
ncbi:MAG: hypothetical protein M1820_001860 [Bogoriella megaspora]|nr:MAG: hypothetical protein M1820_001860 [Bogoriella megaspora]